ncbi:MAG: hypothetical protein AB7K09_04475 [Planctomycetota bacterium]
MTRDPQRIEPVLDCLRRVWAQFPDQRLTQLILNACRGATPAWPDVWEVEEDRLVEGLKRMVHPEPGVVTWLLRRQDDNGNMFEIGRYATREEAEQACREFNARGHKQHYWVDEERGRNA